MNKILIALTIVTCLCSCADKNNNRIYIQGEKIPFRYIEEFELGNHSYIKFVGFSNGNFGVVHDPECKCFKK